MTHKIFLILALMLPALVSCKSPKGGDASQQKESGPNHQGAPKTAPVEVQEVTYLGNGYRVITVDTAQSQIKITSRLSTNHAVKSFATLKSKVEREGRSLFFAMNAGMYHPNWSPVGLYIEDGKTWVPMNLSNGSGNFFMKPNGYFALTKNGPVVGVSESWDPSSGATLASQSGPMLVINGAIHPEFEADSVNTNIRNGVGVTGGRFVHFVISHNKVRMYDFAEFFRSALGCANALYFDGHISQAYVRGVQESQPVTRHFGTLLYTE